MKKHNLKSSLLAALMLTSGIAFADEQYPATDFQPTIVYQNEEYISKDSANTASASSTSSVQSAATDDKYPAANFQPEVVYSDPNYKHGSGTIGASAEEGAVVSSNAAASSTNAKAADSTTSYWIGLIVMAIGGAVFFKSSGCAKCTKTADAPVSPSSNAGTPGGLTGVARYLNRTSGTGVSRYLERVVKTGAAHAATGVERYIRNRR